MIWMQSSKIDDIINLKKKHNLIEEDATDKKQREWYDFAIRSGLVITEYRNDRLVGFLEFVCLNTIPDHLDHISRYITDFLTGSVLFVGNCIAEDRKTLWNLKRQLFKRIKNFSYLCWHKKKTGVIRVFKNIRYVKEVSKN